MTPLVSILIPAFNSEAWIADTLRSAIGQSWERKEIIVVDDGSTDRTAEVARSFEPQGVRVVVQKNQGAQVARNHALSLSKGDYIQWLDADDLLSSDKIDRQLSALGPEFNPRTLLSSAWGTFIYRTSRTEFTKTGLWCDLTPLEFMLRKMEWCVFMQTSVWLVSRELSEAAGPWDVTLACDQDGEYSCRVLRASESVRFVPEGKVFYRRGARSTVSRIGHSNRKLESLWRSKKLHIEYLLSMENSDRTRKAGIHYLQHYLPSFYPWRPDIIAEMRALAEELGGSLAEPRMPGKYEWIRRIAGWEFAKKCQAYALSSKWSAISTWDKMMFAIEKRAGAPPTDDSMTRHASSARS
ncbi:MAG: glycosyltransferase family 2 protein [Terriglobales bacterium]